MSVRVDIRGLPELQGMLRNLTETQIPTAVRIALNKTAWDVRQAQIAQVPQVFDRPTPFIAKGVFYTKATPAKMYSVAGWEAKRDPVIAPHVAGGQRFSKRAEEVLRASGIMSAGSWLVPGPACPLNRYGNPTKAVWNKLYAAMPSLRTVGGTYENWFIGGKYPRRNLYAGIWERKGGIIRPVFFFTRAPGYQVRYDFYGIADRKAREVLPRYLSESVRKALEIAARRGT